MLIHCQESALERQGRKIGWLARLLRRWRNMIETRRALRLLSATDDRMLKDMGISRGDVDLLVRHGRPRAKSSERD